MTRLLRTLTVCGLLLASAVPARAAKRVGNGSILLINLQTKQITDAKTKEVSSLVDQKTGKNEFEIRSDDKIVLVIEDANPFLFTYEFKAGPPTDTDDYKAALEFAGKLTGLLGRFGLTTRAKTLTVNGFGPADFRDPLARLGEHVLALPRLIGLSFGSAADEAKLRAVPVDEDWQGDIKAVEDGLAHLSDIARECARTGSVHTGDNVTLMCDEPYTWALSEDRANQDQAIAKAVLALERSKAVLTERQAAVKTAQLNQQSKPTASAKAALDTLLKALSTSADTAAADVKAKEGDLAELQHARDDARASASAETLSAFIQSINNDRTDIDKTLALLKDFLGDLATLHHPVNVDQITYSIQNKPGTLTVKARDRYESVLDASTKAYRSNRAGDYAFELHPYQPVHLSVGGAAVAGMFIKNPTFTAVKDGDAFVVTRKDDDPVIFKVAAMLNITPQSWNEPTFSGYFQLGVTPDPDEVGLYFGAGVRAQTLFSFGGGLMLQQVQKLGQGLSVGDRLDDPAKLKTVSEFRPGLYFHITVSLPK